MGKRDNYKNFKDFKSKNYNKLLNEYESNKNNGNSMRSTDDCTFDEYCLAQWQWL